VSLEICSCVSLRRRGWLGASRRPYSPLSRFLASS
jgi:hypothetical protein